MTETLSVVVEREMPFPPEKLWRALTQPHLIEEWLMKNDFMPVVGHQFNFRADYLPNGKLDCKVLAIEPNKTLSYTWGSTSDNAAFNLKSVVTFTLTPTPQELTCVWSNRAFGQIRSRLTAAPNTGGSSSSGSWSRSWPSRTEAVAP
jgi:uncharacterized protein YndB with AHSA1/START domain